MTLCSQVLLSFKDKVFLLEDGMKKVCRYLSLFFRFVVLVATLLIGLKMILLKALGVNAVNNLDTSLTVFAVSLAILVVYNSYYMENK